MDTTGIFNSYHDFDNQGNLSANGKKEFWKFVDQTMKKFNRGEIDMMPGESC